ncbi:hypothetical protein GCM10007853_19130 [Algimonas ampicilliniresistens]|jgi:hypothetical protein|uniref:Uncharacterized protein n=1 Tax=Algimonas ampicilliniresistens TaxID=1298735 RepID=A0ABQ5VAM9_9PROT|nr:hypothetical protein [Algimonas ampicilliniresistens]GLQ24039.1 hypothetical protein GCM10007853_19130 [Algimonas ampicilliniresistens]
MKKMLFIVGGLLLLLIAILVWLAGSVGPETAPQDVRTIELPDTYGN